MYAINFLIAILLPLLPIFRLIGPTNGVPLHFNNPEAAFLIGELIAITMYWFGYVRGWVEKGYWNEGIYFAVFSCFVLFLFLSTIIQAWQFFWFIGIMSFVLGWLSSLGRGIRYPLWLKIMATYSIISLSFSIPVLLGMSFFYLTPYHYYFYKNLVSNYLGTFTGLW